MEPIDLELPPVGAKVIRGSLKGLEGASVYKGISYCDAVRRATFGEKLVVAPGSIEVCKWAPPVLGFKSAEGDFERGLEPRLDEGVAGVYLAPLAGYDAGDPPDAVIIRARPAQLRRLIDAVGPGGITEDFTGEIGKSAVGIIRQRFSIRSILSFFSNRVVSRLRRWKRFDDLTRVAFSNQAITTVFEKIIRNTVADMSICRNSTVTPIVKDAGNVSFFCVGGVSWGRNDPANMTSGFPYRMIEGIYDRLDFPGKR